MTWTIAVPAISTQCLMREIRILWSTVSKAPKSIKITESTESVANKISLKTCAIMQHFCPDISGLFKNDNAPILKWTEVGTEWFNDYENVLMCFICGRLHIRQGALPASWKTVFWKNSVPLPLLNPFHLLLIHLSISLCVQSNQWSEKGESKGEMDCWLSVWLDPWTGWSVVRKLE